VHSAVTQSSIPTVSHHTLVTLHCATLYYTHTYTQYAGGDRLFDG